MRPVRTARSNMAYLGPTSDVGDAWVHATSLAAYLVWELDDADRAAIAAGGNLRLGVWQHPMPPVSLETTHEQALSPEGARWHERARRELRKVADSPLRVPPGCWAVSSDVWIALQRDGALESSDVPTLLGRPLMRFDDGPTDRLVYEAMKP